MAFEAYVSLFRTAANKQTVSVAAAIAHEHKMNQNEIRNNIMTENIAKSAWYHAVWLYYKTQNECETLYDRCKAENAMRRQWKLFASSFLYIGPRVPDLPT